ncbi:GNAT family N-acetyltransferase [Aquimarina mytili]|uniref:GNAT family N-acetyltransferase n=1 Tax=Aquimarina mytili TaxID=874423 RepID=A0A937DAP1_9FLAO|nr:GNAT family N-acetyltransferase [Aquimarina mytili]MBL0684942.1 GNAT family N-acetyltransferase [Aquimarina mytili]
MKKITIRKAIPEELEWVNEKYKAIGFTSSNYNTEYIALAEIKNTKCGLGRVVVIDAQNVELGGIYVFDEFQGLGIAQKIIHHLLENTIQNKKIWCLPFKNLEHFYKKFGFFDEKIDHSKIPNKIYEKYAWCNQNQNYKEEVLLLSK